MDRPQYIQNFHYPQLFSYDSCRWPYSKPYPNPMYLKISPGTHYHCTSGIVYSRTIYRIESVREANQFKSIRMGAYTNKDNNFSIVLSPNHSK